MTITLITATVKQPATLLKTRWGEKYKAVLHDGNQDIEIWKKHNDLSLLGLAAGQQITLAAQPATRQDGSSYMQYEIVGIADRPPSPPSPPTATVTVTGTLNPHQAFKRCKPQ